MSFGLQLLHTTTLIAHIAAGAVGLLLAGPILFAPKRRGRHTTLGRIYGVATAVLCLSAFVLAAYDPVRLWPFVPIGVATVAWAGTGIWLARRRPRRGAWFSWHLSLMGSSVIAFVTAFAMQMADNALWSMIGPTIVGTPLIAYRNLVAAGVARPIRLRGGVPAARGRPLP